MPKRTWKPRRRKRNGKEFGPAFIELGGERIILDADPNDTKATEEEYKRRYHTWMANGKKPTPSKNTEPTGMTGDELAIRYLDEAKDYHSQQPRTYRHCRTAMGYFTRHFGSELVSNFTPASLVHIRKKIVEDGCTRGKVNYYVQIIKQAFEQGTIFWGVPPIVYHALLAVKGLKMGKTTARESEPFEPVADEIVEETLPYFHPIIRDMVMVQRLCCMRPQDVCNLRLRDIDMSGDVWLYYPATHKNKNRGKVLIKAIGKRAQVILMKYIEKRGDTPDKFLFSPLDGLSRRGRDYFTPERYGREVAKGVKLAGVEKWTPQQIRVTAIDEVREKFGLEFAQSSAGHSNFSTTERHYAPIGFRKAIEVASKIG